LLLLETVN